MVQVVFEACSLAIAAEAHKRARIIYGLVRHGWESVKKTEADYANEVRAKLEKSLHRRSKGLGFEVVKKSEPVLEMETGSSAWVGRPSTA